MPMDRVFSITFKGPHPSGTNAIKVFEVGGGPAGFVFCGRGVACVRAWIDLMPTSPGVNPLSKYVWGVLLRCPIEYGHVNVSIRYYFRRNALVCSVISLPDAWYLADTHGHPLLNLIKAKISLLPSTVVASGRVAEAYSDILQGIKAITRQILNGVAIQYAAFHHPRLILPLCLC
jgi:hypothetical protein